MNFNLNLHIQVVFPIQMRLPFFSVEFSDFLFASKNAVFMALKRNGDSKHLNNVESSDDVSAVGFLKFWIKNRTLY